MSPRWESTAITIGANAVESVLSALLAVVVAAVGACVAADAGDVAAALPPVLEHPPSVAADALFGLVPPAEVDRALTDLGTTGIAVRHPMRDLVDVLGTEPGPDSEHFAHTLATGARTPGGGHPVAPLDSSRANAATARSLAGLLQALWPPNPALSSTSATTPASSNTKTAKPTPSSPSPNQQSRP